MNNYDMFTAFVKSPNSKIDVLGIEINLNNEPENEKIDWVDDNQNEFYVTERVNFNVSLKIKKTFPFKKCDN